MDIDSYFEMFKRGLSKSVQVLLNGIEAGSVYSASMRQLESRPTQR